MRRHLIKIGMIWLLFNSYAFSERFEQNGVKDGNIRLSLGFYSEQNDKDKPDTYNLETQVGYFVNDNIEAYFGINTATKNKDTTFVLSPGINYYFYKTPIFTPYIGFQYYYQNTTNEYVEAQEGNTFYLGTHIFLNENVALSPEFGVNYIDFKEKKNTYFNTFLSYFF